MMMMDIGRVEETMTEDILAGLTGKILGMRIDGGIEGIGKKRQMTRGKKGEEDVERGIIDRLGMGLRSYYRI